VRHIRKKKPVDMDFTIVYENREVGNGKRPWLFLERRWPMVKEYMKTGDYTIKGFEDILAIEKKQDIRELFQCLTASERPRFKRFLKRLSKFEVKCIVVGESFCADKIYKEVKRLRYVSNGKCGLTAETAFYWIAEIGITYNIPVLFVGSDTLENVVCNVFEAAYKRAKELAK
jgi:hypothetical protein